MGQRDGGVRPDPDPEPVSAHPDSITLSNIQDRTHHLRPAQRLQSISSDSEFDDKPDKE
jgi:hypothetical protein